MPRRVRLYAGPIARIRYTATSNVAKFAGIALLGLAIVGAVIGSIPFIPAIYDRAAASVEVAGGYVRDQLTVADTVTPSKEGPAEAALRLEAEQYLRISEACVQEASIGGQNSRGLTYAISQLDEKLSATWLDSASVTETRDTVMEKWKGITDESVWAKESCAAIRPATPAS